jgi:hypothetical protein
MLRKVSLMLDKHLEFVLIVFRYFLLVAFLFFLPRNKGVVYNILIWLFLFIGVGLQSCFYFMEAYARKSCPENVKFSSSINKNILLFLQNTLWDKVMPRSFVCRVSLPSSKLLHIDL